MVCAVGREHRCLAVLGEHELAVVDAQHGLLLCLFAVERLCFELALVHDHRVAAAQTHTLKVARSVLKHELAARVQVDGVERCHAQALRREGRFTIQHRVAVGRETGLIARALAVGQHNGLARRRFKTLQSFVGSCCQQQAVAVGTDVGNHLTAVRQCDLLHTLNAKHLRHHGEW